VTRVLLEAARPAELATAIADAYGFTERERAIAALVARGLTAAEIADQLHLSGYTVQDHLKAQSSPSPTRAREVRSCPVSSSTTTSPD
jgi:DNA-binding CsgD family transcriptional regulator